MDKNTGTFITKRYTRGERQERQKVTFDLIKWYVHVCRMQAGTLNVKLHITNPNKIKHCKLQLHMMKWRAQLGILLRQYCKWVNCECQLFASFAFHWFNQIWKSYAESPSLETLSVAHTDWEAHTWAGWSLPQGRLDWDNCEQRRQQRLTTGRAFFFITLA